jgi:DNA invertase Pin-like site-specific DNA recombinase
MPESRSIAYYLRVSTAAQDYPAQLHALQEFARRKGWAPPARRNLFAEKISGAKTKRRELDRMLQACRDGKFDTIIAYRVDRIGRSLPHLLQIYEECEAKAIRLIGAADNVDTEDNRMGARIFRQAMALVASITREMIQENTRNGQAAAAKQGRFAGRPPEKRAAILEAVKLRLRGIAPGKIAQRTGVSKSYLSLVFNRRRRVPGVVIPAGGFPPVRKVKKSIPCKK